MVSIKHVVSLCSYIISATIFTSCLCKATLECKNKDSERVICPSFDAITHNIPHTNWKKLNVINDGNVPLSVIKRGTFKNYSNIDDLQVKNLASGIERSAFEGLNSLHELHLDDNNLEAIIPGIFDNLPIVDLFIFKCGVKKIYRRSFRNLPNLKRLFIYGNYINSIEENIFTGTWLSTLVLRKNRITNVAVNAFARMPFLEFLSLEENELTEFEPHATIGFAPKLKDFYINRNEIRQINKNMFNVMPLVEGLLLNLNQIQNINDDTFAELTALRLLDISNNDIKELRPAIFDSFGQDKMKNLFIHNNKLTFLNPDVLTRLPNLNTISIGGNPWQCPCYRHIEFYLKNSNTTVVCQEEYNKGSRPICIISRYYPDQCIYDVDKVKDVIEVYDKEIKEYSKLPPVCNINDVETPILGP